MFSTLESCGFFLRCFACDCLDFCIYIYIYVYIYIFLMARCRVVSVGLSLEVFTLWIGVDPFYCGVVWILSLWTLALPVLWTYEASVEYMIAIEGVRSLYSFAGWWLCMVLASCLFSFGLLIGGASAPFCYVACCDFL